MRVSEPCELSIEAMRERLLAVTFLSTEAIQAVLRAAEANQSLESRQKWKRDAVFAMENAMGRILGVLDAIPGKYTYAGD